jgi:uncharacterized protein YecE (DUF72 family)
VPSRIPPIPEPDPEQYRAARELASRASEPAVAGNVLFGTVGWTDPTLLKAGTFYPKGAKTARDRLGYYARHFSLVEVAATYYSLLPRENAEQWVEITPPSFVFDVKAHPVLTTHPIEVARLPADLKAACVRAGFEARVYPAKLPAELRSEIEARFRALLEPLVAAGRLGAVVLQFPAWFVRSRENIAELERLAASFHDVPLAVEFRHATWLTENSRQHTLDLLRRSAMSYVVVDEPAVAGAVPAVLAVTNPKLVIVRFHGRNSRTWLKRGASVHERFDYLYSKAELTPWIASLETLAAEAESVHGSFNNCVRDYAVLNAKELSVLLEEGRAEDGAAPSPA